MKVPGDSRNVRHSVFFFSPEKNGDHPDEPVFIVEFPDQADGGATAMASLDWMTEHVAYNRELWDTEWDWSSVSVRLPGQRLRQASLTVTEKDDVMTMTFHDKADPSQLIFEHSM
jgi:hypothetical protein